MGRIGFSLVLLIGLMLAPPMVRAQDAQPEVPLGQRMEQYGKLQEQLLPLFAGKDFEKAADICRKQIALVPESPEPHYNLACAQARQGQKDAALLELGEAIELGFSDIAHMREDEDLASLHDDAKFAELLKKARDKELNAPHENPMEVAGVKTIENFPEGGLRYRLRIDPAADAKKPARLLVWLHPTGGSMDSVVEAMAPAFAKDGYALLVFTQLNYNFWSEQDARALIEKTLPDVAKIEGVDAKKPVLLGFSAGGQLALQLWHHKPADFGGIVVDAAYPLDAQKYAGGQIAPFDLPKDDAIKSCPILAVVGGGDRGSALWQSVKKTWLTAHVPLTVHIISDKGHGWLFEGAETAALHDWLHRVAAGELPADVMKKRPLPGEEEAKPVKVIYIR